MTCIVYLLELYYTSVSILHIYHTLYIGLIPALVSRTFTTRTFLMSIMLAMDRDDDTVSEPVIELVVAEAVD